MKRLLHRGGTLLGQFDWWLVGSLIFLLAIGLVIQYSIDLNDNVANLSQFYKQVTFAVAGLCLFFFFSLVDRNIVKIHPVVAFGVSIFLLASVLAFGASIQGTKGWFVIGAVSVQPVEFVKLLLVVFMASYFSSDASRAKQPRFLMATGAATAIIIGLVLLQPDLGSALILFCIWFGFVA